MRRECAMPELHATRRQLLVIAGNAAVVSALSSVSWPARATPDAMKAAIRDVVKGAPVRPGKVKFDVPPLVENGNTVPITVSVTSPMTDADHVVSIHVFNEKIRNPMSAISISARAPAAARSRPASGSPIRRR